MPFGNFGSGTGMDATRQTPSGGGNFLKDALGFGNPATFLGGGIAGGLGNFFKSRQQGRDMQNQFNMGVAQDQFMNPNRPLQAALQRNFRANLLQNLAGSGAGHGAITPQDLFASFGQSLRGGIDPRLIQEGQNIAGVPGLKVGGQYVGQDPTTLFKPKTAGFLESLGSGFTGMFGG